MRVSLKLSQQGLILVGVPVGLMVIFLLSLFLLLLRVEKEAEEADHSKTIISEANSLVKEYYDAASQLIMYRYTRDEKERRRFEDQLAGTKSSFVKLQHLLKDDPQELAMLADLGGIAEHGMALMRRYERYLAGAEELNALEVAILYRQFTSAGARFTAQLQELVSHESARHQVSSAAEERERALVKNLILAGAIAAIAIGATLASFFTRNTVSRLALLMDNTVRLGKKDSLLPALKGDDEIATLDRFFHKMADDLAEAARKERAILDNAVDVICSIDASGHFTAANPASLAVGGYAPAELVGRHYSEMIARDDVPKFREALERIRVERVPLTLETRVVGAGAAVLHMSWSLRWSEPEQSLFCVAHDISDRKEVERLKQEFVAVISHELRTPVTSLQATLTLLESGAYGQLNDTGAKRIRSAESGVSRLITLINDLLDIEKMEAGKLSMTFADLDLADIVERSLEAVQGFAEQQGVSVKADKPSVKVLADGDRIVQVMVNLLSNAIKFSDDGGGVEVKVEEKQDCLEVQVIDHGPGVPEGYEKTIFAKYAQAQSPDGKKRKGTGLGLPICKAIVEQHGGAIGVRRTEGGGSTFWFSLPRR